MKNFLLFAGSLYYPTGGWDDFVDSFATIEEAQAAGRKSKCDWWQVVDLATGKRIDE